MSLDLKVAQETTSEQVNDWITLKTVMFDDDLVEVMQGFVLASSIFLTGFYVLQWFRGKCAPEAIYVSIVTTIIYASALLTGKSLTWVTVAKDFEVPLGKFLLNINLIGRYFAWMMTCPIILMQFVSLFKTVGQRLNDEIESFIIYGDQVMIVMGKFSLL